MAVPCHLPPDRAAVVSVIHVSAMRGDGSVENPERMVELYFGLDGALLACFDPINGAPDAVFGRTVALHAQRGRAAAAAYQEAD